MTRRLDGEIAIITGSTSGLGRTVAQLFVEEGARVIVTGRNRDRGAELVAELGDAAVFVAADIGTSAGCSEVVSAAVDTFGGLSILVNNAVSPNAIAADGPIADVDTEVWEEMLRLNVIALGWLCRDAIPTMIDGGGGAIVNVSSRTAERATPRVAAYTASKGAMNALTRSITLDYARQGIRCNTVQPGYIIHESRDVQNSAERWAQIESMCLTRPATARDVAYAIAFLASREAEVISGVTLQVDSGSSAGRARTFDQP